jgi:predicted N-formylglutamate amidohydrolase
LAGAGVSRLFVRDGAMKSLLAAGEHPAVEVRVGDGPFVVVCEHASNRVPQALGTLGLATRDLQRHIAWDPGALEVATGVADRLRGAVVRQRFSRLVIDCNRDPALPDAITAFSENTPIPGNLNLSSEDKTTRINEVWRPFHEALEHLLDGRKEARRPAALVTIHSFTPVYRGVSRPWHVGIISTEERSLAESMLSGLRRDPALIVGDNEPYSPKDNVDYTIRRHGRDRGLPHVMIEIRNDLLASETGREEWATRLAGLLGAVDMSVMAA